MAVTQSEIARRLGVSQVTVSKVLHRSRHSRVSDERGREIWRLAREMGYKPRNFTTHNIGFIDSADTMHLSGSSRNLLFMDQAVREAGFRLLLTSFDYENPQRLNDMINPKTVDGVILTQWFEGGLEKILPPEVPCVLISDEDAVSGIDQVVTDNADIAEKIVQHLIGFGHETICLVSYVDNHSVTSHLKIGARRALVAANLPAENLLSVDVFQDREIAALLQKQLTGAQASTAIIVFGAEKTLTVLHLLNRWKLKVPADISVVGILDSHMFDPWQPQITTTTAHGKEVVEAAVQRLLQRLRKPDLPPSRIALQAQIIHRESVGPVRKPL